MTVTAELHDGTRLEFPDGTDPAVVDRVVKQHLASSPPAVPAPSKSDQFWAGFKDSPATQAVLGGVRGAAGIGATLQHYLNPMEWGNDQADKERRQGINDALGAFGSDPSSLGFATGKAGSELAGTMGVGPALGLGARAVPILRALAPALESAGFTTGNKATGLLGKTGDMAVRSAAGGATGYAGTALVDPENAGTGGTIGALLPPGIKTAGSVGSAIASPIGSVARKVIGEVSPEVQALAEKAKQYGINVPIDRIANSKPLNAAASSLNYVPLSGRAGVERDMQDQLNRAVSRTFGQDSTNVTQALRKAQDDLGQKFEDVLKNNSVNVDQQFLTDLADSANKASNELGADGARIIGKQVDDIVAKAGNGQIDAQAAYNIKKALDRIGQRNSPEAYYALDLKKALMGALDRSLGPQQASAFARTRQQYGTMLDLQKLAQNGAEGDISAARLANMKNINNPDLQDLADISAQFIKPREGIHGAAQRAGGLGVMGTIGGSAFGPVGAVAVPVAGIGLARGANSLLNSNSARAALLRNPNVPGLLQGLSDQTVPGLLRALPAYENQQQSP